VIGAFYYLKIVKIMYFDASGPAFIRERDRSAPHDLAGGVAVSPLGYLSIPYRERRLFALPDRSTTGPAAAPAHTRGRGTVGVH
jgi:hypothetical protein